ncbi:MAG: hypothetical protein P8179_14335 [Candidatus Thiodiazotropha sp.]
MVVIDVVVLGDSEGFVSAGLKKIDFSGSGLFPNVGGGFAEKCVIQP